MRKPIVAFDLDGVCADTTNAVEAKVVDYFGIEKTLLHPGSDYNNVYHLDDTQLKDEVNEYVDYLFKHDASIYLNATPIKGVWLSSRYIKPIAYITRRPAQHGIEEATLKWLEKEGLFKAPVYFVPRGICKSTVAKDLGVDFIIEDSPAEILSCRENGLATVVMSYHYNKIVQKEDTIVVKDWEEINKWWTETWLPQ